MKKTILSISENGSMNQLLQTVLSTRYTFQPVSSVFEAIFHLDKRRNVFLLLVDLDYNQKEKFDFIHHIKTSSVYKRPMIVLSSVDTDKVNEVVIENDVHDYFIKPFDPIKLLNSIDELHAMNKIALPHSFSNR